jgi:hypothetical protein
MQTTRRLLLTLVTLILFGCAQQPKTLPPPHMTVSPSPTLGLAQTVGSPTPIHTTWTVDQVLNGIRLVGLEAVPAQNQHLDVPADVLQDTEYIFFSVPGSGTDAGGLILAFSSQDNFMKTNKYLRDKGWYTGLYYPWVYTRGNILLLINGILSEPEARRYGAALNSVQ